MVTKTVPSELIGALTAFIRWHDYEGAINSNQLFPVKEFTSEDLLKAIDKQLQLARLDAKIEELEYSKVEIGNIPDELWRFNGELLGKWGERKLRLSKLDDRIDKLTAQKAHLTTKGGNNEIHG